MPTLNKSNKLVFTAIRVQLSLPSHFHAIHRIRTRNEQPVLFLQLFLARQP